MEEMTLRGHPRSLDWIVQCFTSPPTQYRLHGDGFYRYYCIRLQWSTDKSTVICTGCTYKYCKYPTSRRLLSSGGWRVQHSSRHSCLFASLFVSDDKPTVVFHESNFSDTVKPAIFACPLFREFRVANIRTLIIYIVLYISNRTQHQANQKWPLNSKHQR